MPRRRPSDIEQPGLLEARVTTAPCVPAIRRAVMEWRGERYKGATKTSRLLLNYWFGTDHRLPNGSRFRYHDAQREAIETLIYASKASGITRRRELLERFAPKVPGMQVHQYDGLPPSAIKEATWR